MKHAAIALSALIATGCAGTARLVATPAPVASVAAATPSIPPRVSQGGLLRGRLPAGSRLRFDGQPVRVAADGRFVIGVARERSGELQLQWIAPDGRETPLLVAIDARQFPLEHVEGVPEATVNPPPEIAARIAREQAAVSAARTRDDDREDYDTRFIWPVQGRISGRFGSQRIYNGTPKSPHSGMDIAAPQGTSVQAPAAGIVTFAAPDLYLTGGTVVLDHGHGVSSNFLHLRRIDVAVGERVEQGQVIGAVGATGRATGPHLHWGMNWFGVRVDPLLQVDTADNPQP